MELLYNLEADVFSYKQESEGSGNKLTHNNSVIALIMMTCSFQKGPDILLHSWRGREKNQTKIYKAVRAVRAAHMATANHCIMVLVKIDNLKVLWLKNKTSKSIIFRNRPLSSYDCVARWEFVLTARCCHHGRWWAQDNCWMRMKLDSWGTGGTPCRGSSSDDLVLSAVESWSDSTTPEATDENADSHEDTDWLVLVSGGLGGGSGQ